MYLRLGPSVKYSTNTALKIRGGGNLKFRTEIIRIKIINIFKVDGGTKINAEIHLNFLEIMFFFSVTGHNKEVLT